MKTTLRSMQNDGITFSLNFYTDRQYPFIIEARGQKIARFKILKNAVNRLELIAQAG